MTEAAAADDTLQFAHKDAGHSLSIHQTKKLPVREYLFPAANLMAKQKEDPNFSLSTVPHAELYVALNARCSTKASRQVYLRAHPSLQGDMEQWASALSALGERSQGALRFLLGVLTEDSRITQTVSASLFGCEEDCLCLADVSDYLVANYLTATEIEMEKVLQSLEFLTMSEPLEAEGTATSP
ncbi:g2026 [Coccomyxa viridis]|uniref:G2026 protein n=1 Tax=Coccomyxa viridis TaxID=1274662 RepID=A0ABP1FJD6_9CHLO